MTIIEEFLKPFRRRSTSPAAFLSEQEEFPGVQYLVCRHIQLSSDLRITQISIVMLPIASANVRFTLENSR
jgi:hypothetical protein